MRNAICFATPEDFMVLRQAVAPSHRFVRSFAHHGAGGRRQNNRKGETVFMSITTAMTSVPKPAPDLIEAFRDAPTSVISDNLARLPGAVGLRPFHRGGRLVGTA